MTLAHEGEEEIWREIPDEPGYFASCFGRIKGPRGLLSLFPKKKGYLACQVNGRQQRVNRLVCKAFHGLPYPEDLVAAHKNGAVYNNNEDNLYWATTEQNAADLVQHQSLLGENHPRAKLTEDDVREIRKKFNSGIAISKIQLEYSHCSRATINHAARGRNWSHVQ